MQYFFTQRLTAVSRETLIRTSILAHQRDDFLRPQRGFLRSSRTRQKMKPRSAGTKLFDRVDLLGQVPGRLELEHDHRTVNRYEEVAARRVHGPDGHIPGTRGIADIDRIRQERRCVLAPR